MAFRYAVSGRPGPVFLEIRPEALYQAVDEDEIEYPAKPAAKYPVVPEEGLPAAGRRAPQRRREAAAPRRERHRPQPLRGRGQDTGGEGGHPHPHLGQRPGRHPRRAPAFPVGRRSHGHAGGHLHGRRGPGRGHQVQLGAQLRGYPGQRQGHTGGHRPGRGGPQPPRPTWRWWATRGRCSRCSTRG